jgi:type VI protein secretion system component VasK
MSPASYLAAPPRVAVGNCSTLVTIRSMWDWLVYAALIVAVIAVLGGLALLAVRVLQAWRSFKRLRRHVFRDLDRVAEKLEATLDKAEAASDTKRLEGSVASLRVSLARLALLREAIDEVTALVPRL